MRNKIIAVGFLLACAAFSQTANAQGTTRICRAAQIKCLQAQNCGGYFAICSDVRAQCDALSRLCHQAATNGPPPVTPPPPVTGCWIDVKTGASAPSPSSDWISWADLKHAHDPATGNNYVQVECPPPATETGLRNTTGLYLGGGLAYNTSTTTITSPIDQQKIKQDPTQALLVGRANFGPWFLTGQVTFAGTPHGSFSDVFPATPAFNTTATVNSGNVYGFNGDAGYTVWNADGWKMGIFGGYYSFNEELYGVFPGFAGTFSLLNDHWGAGEGGVSIEKAFMIGAEPFDLGVTVAGLYDNLRAGAFNGNGGGVRVNGTLSFPLGPVMGNIYAQYANLNASGSNTGAPLTFKDEVWTVGFGVTYKFGASAASAAAPTYPVKALPPK
jgi:hypothetical protein